MTAAQLDRSNRVAAWTAACVLIWQFCVRSQEHDVLSFGWHLFCLERCILHVKTGLTRCSHRSVMVFPPLNVHM
jgi:hypothetical protein